MIDFDRLHFAMTIVAGVAAGLGIGAALSAMQYRNALFFARGRMVASVATQALRLALTALSLVAVARAGAAPLIAAAAGISVARAWSVCRVLRALQ